jgi:ribosome-associated protein
LEPLLASTDRKKSIRRLNTQSRIFKSVVKAIQEKKGEEILSIDLRKVPESVADFFIVCQASSTTQVKAIADFVEKKVQEDCKERPYRQEGSQSAHWVLIDYVNIVIHVMLPSTRQFYKLEEMWSDGNMQHHV